jgi:hypothetical protein
VHQARKGEFKPVPPTVTKAKTKFRVGSKKPRDPQQVNAHL